MSHSLLGSLRNFCVCQSARETLLDSTIQPRLLDTVMRFVLDSENFEVLFKAVSVVRFMVRVCAAHNEVEPVFAVASLRRIEELCAVQPHAGVRNECSRLVCLLPLAAAGRAENKHLFDRLADGLKLVHVMCDQMASEHFIMINEALLALSVLITVDYRKYLTQFSSFLFFLLAYACLIAFCKSI